MPKIKVVYACGINGAFGYNGRLPWPHNKDDLSNFKRETTGCVLVMGANTFKSLPSLLPGRIHVVVECDVHRQDELLTHNGSRPHMVTYGSVQNAIAELKSMNRDIAIIGGSDLIFRTIAGADEIVETEFKDKFKADVFIKHDREWIRNSRILVETIDHNDFVVRRYIK